MVDVNRDLVFHGTNDIKTAIAIVLREIFASDIVNEQYRYVAEDQATDEHPTKIKIWRQWPQRLEFYPSIIISSGAFDASLVAMGSEKEEADQKIVNGVLENETYTGYMRVPITLKVLAKSSMDDREKVTDILIIILRILSRGAFAPYGIGYNKIRVNGEGQFLDDDGLPVFTNSITIDVHTDYTQVFPVDQDLLISKILLRVFGQVKSTDTPFLLAPLENPGPFPPV